MKFRIKKVFEDSNYYPYGWIHYLVQVKITYLFFFKKWITIKIFTMDCDYDFGDYNAELEANKLLQELEK